MLVLENDLKSQTEISKILKELNSDLEIVLFSNEEDFNKWKIKLDQLGLAVLGSGIVKDPHKSMVPLMIMSADLLGLNIKTELITLQNTLWAKDCCLESDKTSIVITTYEKPEFNISEFLSEKISNIIFKPFDSLILKQHLAYALSGHHPSDAKVLGSQKTTVEIEIIKDVQLIELSEVGFTTIVERDIPIGKLAKYYGPFAGPGQQLELFAKCISCEKKNDKLIGVFEYVSVDPVVISGIKKYLAKNKAQSRDIPPAQAGLNKIVNIAVIASDTFPGAAFAESLKSDFRSVHIYRFPTLAIFQGSIKSDKTIELGNEKILHIDALLIEQEQIVDYADPTGKKINESLQAIFKSLTSSSSIKLPVFILANHKMSNEHFRGTIQYVDDIFLQPFDKNYILKILFAKIPGLAWKGEAYHIRFSPLSMLIHAANSIKAIEISEAGVVIEYPRAIDFGDFRKFVLWLPDQVELPQLLANCNYYEEIKKDNGVKYACHFVFFGITEKFLKHIRVWILHDFVSQKNAQG